MIKYTSKVHNIKIKETDFRFLFVEQEDTLPVFTLN